MPVNRDSARSSFRRLWPCALALGLAAPADAQHSVALVADKTTITIALPDNRTVAVPVWGFGLDANGDGDLADTEQGDLPVSVPGPRIVVPAGASSLQIALKNNLAVPVSLVIPGQAFDAAVVRQGDRVYSMTPEAAANGGSHTYTFANLKPGTFLYQSGTHQAVQVQMGLYGAMTHDFDAGEAYDGIAYDNEALLLYSEIDVALHKAVDAGNYGTPSGPTSTIDYAPSLYLVNGKSYANDLVTPPLPGGVAGQRTLLRLLNAGLKSHAPTVQNGAFSIVAEDGNKYPYARGQAVLLLAAGKTHDAVWVPSAAGVYGVYDRFLSLNAAGQGSAGMLAKLGVATAAVASAPGAPNAGPFTFTTNEDVSLSVPGPGLLSAPSTGTSVALVMPTVGGTLTVFGASGNFTYVPGPNFSGVDSFTYVTKSGSQTSSPATVMISVTPVPDLPVALGQSVGIKAGESLPILLSGSDADGEGLSLYVSSLPAAARGTLNRVHPVSGALVPLTASDLSGAPGGGTPLPDGTVIYTALTPGAGSGFSFVARDAAATSAAAPVTVAIQPQEAAAACPGCLPLQIVVNGGAVSSFRWTVEEDRTFDVRPDNLEIERTPSVQFHRSYMPLVKTGVTPAMPSLDRSKRYFVSVLPVAGGYSNGGAPVGVGQSSVNVTVDGPPGASGTGRIPTAQVRVQVFRDDSPLNGELDGDEVGLAGFAATLEDAGGRYGMSAAQQLMDAFGNPLGTTYKACSTGPGTCESYEVASYGNGFVLTDAEGFALFENLVPGKYGVNVIPPGGQAWQQVTTIEGKKAIDAWVKAKEPRYFSEFGGPSGPHAVIGFIQATNRLPASGGNSVTGQITNLRLARPPDPSMYSGAPFDFSRPWVALNTGAGVGGSVLYAQPTDEDGNFTIPHVPSGSYTLAVFDSALNVIIASKVVNVTGGDVALGPVPVMQWFSRLYNYVFEDANEDGFRQPGEAGMQEQAINIRFRDGSVYQSAPTDRTGFVPFEEVFPFFSWLIAEVDFTRFKATGVTAVVDEGGPVSKPDGSPLDEDWPGEVGAEVDPRVLSPQPQSDSGGAKFRTETGPVLLEAFQGFIGQSNVLLWGKAPYAPAGSIVTDVNYPPFDQFPTGSDQDPNGNGAFDGDQFHGGISGIIHYSTTRAENDPRWGGAEVWEPGIPDVRVQLWDATRTKLLNEVTSDSWDGSLPEGCQVPAGQEFSYRGTMRDCFDGLRNWNQVRPGVFDGGYAFFSQVEPVTPSAAAWLTPVAGRAAGYREVPLPAGKYVVKVIPPAGYKVVKEEDKNVDFGMEFIPQQFLLTGYALGDGGPSDAPPVPSVDNTPLAAPFCVGSLHPVPNELALFPGVAGAYAGEARPTCDAKLVNLRNGQNPGANFFLFTEAPVAGHITGFVLDDASNELDPNSPQFGEKFAPPFLPISVRDWKGREITRTYTDAYGVYNALVPSTYTANVPAPSGMSAQLLSVCVNSPSSPNGSADPYFNPKYSHSCFPLPFMPGTTTYLDTPVVPTAAFTGADQLPLDAAFPTQTPVIKQVSNTAAGLSGARGPYAVDCGNGALLLPALCPLGPGAVPTATRTAARRIVIQSLGSAPVPNPYYDGLGGTQQRLVTRDYGFGGPDTNGVVRLAQRDAVSGVTSNAALAVESWSDLSITAVVPPGAQTGQLTVERCLARTGGPTGPCTSWRESVLGVTLTVATTPRHLARAPRVVAAGGNIQAVIDSSATLPGDLVLVAPGVYEQTVVMTKPVRLQGWGAAVTDINVTRSPEESLQNWRDQVGGILASDAARTRFLLAEQVNILGTPPFVDGILSATLGGEAGGLLVLARSASFVLQGLNPNGTCNALALLPVNQTYCVQDEALLGTPARRANARIDGFSIHGASDAAGVMVNGNARYLEISNNRIFNNFSAYAGGIKLGHPGAERTLAEEDANNDNVYVHNNQVTENASLEGYFAGAGGGGIVIGTGAPGYLLQNNWIAGNFTGGQGGGIAHNGLSPNAVIDRNTIVFNESFNQSVTVGGGGLLISGLPPAGVGALSPGAGAVQVSNNLIQGNQAAAGDGGGISLSFVNGVDLTNPTPDYRVDIFNNIIADNVAAFAGGGIALQDSVNVRIVHNTIVHNDSLATAGGAFAPGSPQQSTPQPAGIVSREHVQTLPGSAGAFSSPLLRNSILWENRSFYFGEVPGGIQNPGDPAHTYGLINSPAGTGRTACEEPAGTAWTCWDLGVVGAAGSLQPQFSVLTSTAGYAASNVSTPPAFVAQYVNVARKATALVGEAASATILVPAAFDEGGNFIRPQFGPLSLTRRPDDPQIATSGLFWANYHVTAGGAGGQNLNLLFAPGSVPGAVQLDFDAEARPNFGPHRGADQKEAADAPTTPVPTRR